MDAAETDAMWMMFFSQVILEKGLGHNGMTMTSLKEEGYQAVFIGIGQYLSKASFCSFCVFVFEPNSMHLSSASSVDWQTSFVCIRISFFLNRGHLAKLISVLISGDRHNQCPLFLGPNPCNAFYFVVWFFFQPFISCGLSFSAFCHPFSVLHCVLNTHTCPPFKCHIHFILCAWSFILTLNALPARGVRSFL